MSADTVKSLLDSIDKFLEDVEHGRRGHFEDGATYARADLAVLRRMLSGRIERMGNDGVALPTQYLLRSE